MQNWDMLEETAGKFQTHTHTYFVLETFAHIILAHICSFYQLRKLSDQRLLSHSISLFGFFAVIQMVFCMNKMMELNTTVSRPLGIFSGYISLPMP